MYVTGVFHATAFVEDKSQPIDPDHAQSLINDHPEQITRLLDCGEDARGDHLLMVAFDSGLSLMVTTTI